MAQTPEKPPRAWRWDSDDGVAALQDVATALVALHDVENPGTFQLPYPAEAQRALDRLALTCLWLRCPLPESVPGLIEWGATRILDDWPLHLPEGTAHPDGRLLDEDTRLPTQLCLEWAADAERHPANRFDRQVLAFAADRCRAEDDQETYLAFRRQLAKEPVTTKNKLSTMLGRTDMDADLVRDVLNEVYRPAPPGSVEKGRAVLCGRCGILLVRTRRSEWRCEREECRRRGVREGKELDARDGGLRQLTRPVRQWITAPGRVALKLEQRLRAWCEVELWPDFGAFDLRLVLPGGVVWAVDVHDWVDPGLLGRLREQPRPDLAAHRRLWVVPRESVTAVSGYRTRYREVRPIGPELLSDAELVSEVKAFVENGPRGREAPDDRPQ